MKRKKTYYREVIYALLLMIFAIAIGSEVVAQQSTGSTNSTVGSSSYDHAIGVRAGAEPGVSFKTFIQSATALEFIGWFGNRSVGITALYELYAPAFQTAGLNWYYGIGAHAKLQSRNFGWGYGWRNDVFYDDAVAVGVDGIVGIEYKIEPIPVAVSLDVKPYVEIWTGGNLGWFIDPGLGVKYTF